ncbi:SurA N-terminal domain-containing protein [Pontibacter sp. JAM-7]|uniref:SurA N-terminal domain-containing protein n=1 Tax=Pontibacter sp. JAM-7 TaxID=3366581 RepID=UPI003AF78574
MLQSIRDNSQGIVAKIIVGLIAVTFALFGVESLVSLTAGSNAPATVNGTEISQQELLRGVQLQRRQMLSQMGENADPTLLDDNLISEMVLNSLIDQTVLLQSAEGQGLAFSDRMIDQMIVSTEAFQVNGKFDRNQFELVLRNAGLTPMMYRQLLRREKLTEQESMAYRVSAFTLPHEVEHVVALDRQTRDMRYFTLDAAPVREAVQVSEEALADYYAEHQSEYMTEEQVEIEYLLLDQAVLAEGVEITSADLQAAYEDLKNTYVAQELRHAAHILIEITDDRNAAGALAKAQDLAERIKSGEAFADLARTESDDPVSAEMGGDLGTNERGVFSPEFDDALFSLNENTVSEPVKTEFGYHLIKLLGTEKATVPSFAEAEADLRENLRQQRAEELYVEALERLADISFSAGDLREPAEALSLTIETAGPFGRAGAEDDITSSPRLLATAFDPELIKEGLNSTPVELDSGRSVVLRITAYHEPREQTLDEVRDQLVAQLQEQQIEAEMDQRAAALLSQLEAGETLESVAVEAEIKTQAGVTRNQRDVVAEIRSKLFEMAKPKSDQTNFGKAVLLDGSVAIIALDSVQAGDTELSEQELRMMGQMLSSRRGQENYQSLMGYLKDQAEIERL